MRIKLATQEANEFEHSYGHNVSQFEGDMPECEEEVQQMKNLKAATRSSGKRKKNQQ